VGVSWNYTILVFITSGYTLNIINFLKMFIEGGSGKNGSSVAVSIAIHKKNYKMFQIET